MPSRRQTRLPAPPAAEARTTPFPFEKFPLEIRYIILSFLTATELCGISRSSTIYRQILLPSVFHAVHFAGEYDEVAYMLEAFLYHRRQRVMKPLWESVRRFTVTIGDEWAPKGDEAMSKLPGRILDGLQRTTQVRTFCLTFNHCDRYIQKRFLTLLRDSPAWPMVTTLSVTAYRSVVERIMNHWLPGIIENPSSFSQEHYWTYWATRNSTGKITRLFIGNARFVIRREDSLDFLEQWSNERMWLELEWFVLGYFLPGWQAHKHPYYEADRGAPCYNSISHDALLGRGIQALVNTLTRMPRLRRFAFWVHRSELGPCLVRQNWTTNYDVLAPAELDAWYMDLTCRILTLLPNLERLSIADNQGIVYVGIRTSQGLSVEAMRCAVPDYLATGISKFVCL